MVVVNVVEFNEDKEFNPDFIFTEVGNIIDHKISRISKFKSLKFFVIAL